MSDDTISDNEVLWRSVRQGHLRLDHTGNQVIPDYGVFMLEDKDKSGNLSLGRAARLALDSFLPCNPGVLSLRAGCIRSVDSLQVVPKPTNPDEADILGLPRPATGFEDDDAVVYARQLLACCDGGWVKAPGQASIDRVKRRPQHA